MNLELLLDAAVFLENQEKAAVTDEAGKLRTPSPVACSPPPPLHAQHSPTDPVHHTTSQHNPAVQVHPDAVQSPQPVLTRHTSPAHQLNTPALHHHVSATSPPSSTVHALPRAVYQYSSPHLRSPHSSTSILAPSHTRHSATPRDSSPNLQPYVPHSAAPGGGRCLDELGQTQNTKGDSPTERLRGAQLPNRATQEQGCGLPSLHHSPPTTALTPRPAYSFTNGNIRQSSSSSPCRLSSNCLPQHVNTAVDGGRTVVTSAAVPAVATTPSSDRSHTLQAISKISPVGPALGHLRHASHLEMRLCPPADRADTKQAVADVINGKQAIVPRINDKQAVGDGLNGLTRFNGSVYRSYVDSEVDQQHNSFLQHYGSIAPTLRDDGLKRRAGSVSSTPSREIHNKLEKNRRAHLKECFDLLRRQIPNMDDKKVSNQNILKAAFKCINTLKRKEREHEHEMEHLAREKIAHQQHLASLKKELAARWDHIDFNTILPDMNSLDQHKDKETKSTTTASEQPDMDDDMTIQRGSVLPHTGSASQEGRYNLSNGLSTLVSAGGSLLQYNRPVSDCEPVQGTPLQSRKPGTALYSQNVRERSPPSLPIIVPSSSFTLIKDSSNNISSINSMCQRKSLPNRVSPVITYAPQDPQNLTSVVTYTPQPSPQPGLLGTCTHHISPQTAPIVTYTPQPSPQSPNSLNIATQSPPHALSVALTYTAPQFGNSFPTNELTDAPRELCQDPNQPLNLSTNAAVVTPLRRISECAALSSVQIASVSHSQASIKMEDAIYHTANQQCQTSSPSWFIQHQEKVQGESFQKVELKFVDSINTAQIIRPPTTFSKMVPAAGVSDATDALRLQQPTTHIITTLAPTATVLNNSTNNMASFGLQNITTAVTTMQSSSVPALLTPKSEVTSANLAPILVSAVSASEASCPNTAPSDSYLRLVSSSSASLVHSSDTNSISGGLHGGTTALMPIMQSTGVHHIPVRIAASAGNLVSIITPELGYKLVPADHPFTTNGAKPITIALPPGDMTEGGSDVEAEGLTAKGGGVMVAMPRNGMATVHVTVPSPQRCLRLGGGSASLNLSTSLASDTSTQPTTTLRLTPTSVIPSYLPFQGNNGVSQLVPGMVVTPVVALSNGDAATVAKGAKVATACSLTYQQQTSTGKGTALLLPSGHYGGPLNHHHFTHNAALVVVSSTGVSPGGGTHKTFVSSPNICTSSPSGSIVAANVAETISTYSLSK